MVVKEDGDFPVIEPNEVQYIDVAPNQIASISASLIPFLEHDDADKCVDGLKYDASAVPLLKPKRAPIVGTGLELRIASDARVLMNY